MTEYLDCKLTITKERTVRFDVTPTPIPLNIEADLCDDDLTKLTVQRLNRFIGGNTGFCQKADLSLLGRHLYHILFDGKTRVDDVATDLTLGKRFALTYETFENEFERRKHQTDKNDPNYHLRVTLVFEEGMEELAGYPWEFLYIPRPNKTGFFVTGENKELILTRFIIGHELVNKDRPPEKKLVIIVAWSQPKELGPVIESDTVLAIQELAENIEKELQGYDIEVVHLPQATHQMLKDLIKEKKPQIVHFIGHGRIYEGVSQIALIKTKEEKTEEQAKMAIQRREPDEAKWINSESMRALFIDEPPRLVFLHACNSATAPNSLEVFKSTAEQVLRAKVPFVVAMQYEISNDDATDFAKTFYKKLGDGLSIDEAVKEGRNELGKKAPSWGHPRFGTPVVYLQTKDSVIVLKEKKEDKEEPFVKQNCPYMNCPNSISPDQASCGCEKRLRLKQCPRCKKANRRDETECLFCEYVFTGEKHPRTTVISQDSVSFRQVSRSAGQAEPPTPANPRQ